MSLPKPRRVASRRVSFVGPRTGANWRVTLEAWVSGRHWWIMALGRSSSRAASGHADSVEAARDAALASFERLSEHPTGAMEDAS